MNLTPVPGSSSISALGYDPVSRRATIQFKNSSALYHYPNVEQADFDALKNAPSVGTHFGMHFRLKYPGEKVAAPKPEGRQ
jgi:KTSC domain